MIRKFLLIGESGLLLYYLNQDEAEIDNDLLSGFCQAIHSISLELKYPLKAVEFEDHKMIIEVIEHQGQKNLLFVALYDKYHIDEGIKNKIYTIYMKVFKELDLTNETVRLDFEGLTEEILGVLNDDPLKKFIEQKKAVLIEIMEPVLREKDNNIIAYALTSSSNTLLYYNASFDLLAFRPTETLADILLEYLQVFEMETIPQGDKFIGSDQPNGLDEQDFFITEEKTYGIVINTCINLPEEPKNELLLYLFGKNMLIRSIVPNIEERLRNRFQEA
ncbi:MAG: hypothetical protein ACTSR8_05675 [Promethearchaeota archaeon]